MKKYILILFTVLATTFMSCDEELQIFPTDQAASEVAFRGEGDFTNALRGMYRRMLGGTYYGGELQGYDVMTDNLIISPEGRTSQQFRHDWAYDQNTGSAGFLAQTFAVVNAANFIIENIDVLDDGDFKNNVLGQALTGRALAHFDAVRYFAKIPTQSSDAGSSLALPYITDTEINNLPSRITVAEYYGNLINDLTTAANLIGSSNGVYQMNKDATNGLLAKVYLHMGEWQKAIDAANLVTTPISDRSSFTGIWNDSDSPGIIFKLRNDNNLQEGVGIPYNQTAGGVKDEYVPDYEFYQMFDATDIRLSAYIRTGEFAGNMYNHIVKWYSSVSTSFLGTVDAKVLRASEVMLTKAEALSELNQDDAARAALDAVRSNRYSGFVTGVEVGSALKDAIAKERRIELAFEGTRFSDIKRYGIDCQRSSFGHFADGTGLPAVFKLLPASDTRFQLPIPIGEINLNPNIVQNPGYGSE
ncbi:RagB/SusD family nutrient uptake outer membrane protein [Seonamhaeicola maritimus]|uniref:RagB/SusD family nutrient uptake outer membrane protein n=1 Tax=Seonamhaeicola maritimus TaxID=2591822 RepID=UPI00249519B2|nr:RagB/SusD family nutrient uptake outer membrane protein [Seonamhaeicola maritimus]